MRPSGDKKRGAAFRRHRPDAATGGRYRGCLIGGAVGDALGAPVEFMSRHEILQCFGAKGIRDFVPAFGRIGAITDDIGGLGAPSPRGQTA